MFGFIVAFVCLLGLLAMARPHHRHGHRGMRSLSRLFRRLDTTPGQEKVIRDALIDLRDAARETWHDTRDARPELAAILRSEEVDDDALQAWLSARGLTFDELRPRIVNAIRRIHEVLDQRQRRALGDLVERGNLHGPWGWRHRWGG